MNFNAAFWWIPFHNILYVYYIFLVQIVQAMKCNHRWEYFELTDRSTVPVPLPNCAQKMVTLLVNAEFSSVSALLRSSESPVGDTSTRTRARRMKVMGRMSCQMTANQFRKELRSRLIKTARNCCIQRPRPVFKSMRSKQTEGITVSKSTGLLSAPDLNSIISLSTA